MDEFFVYIFGKMQEKKLDKTRPSQDHQGKKERKKK
jgi:hypothetical protein